MKITTATPKKRMDAYFSVFNGHVNNAATRANAEFIAQFTQEAYDKEIKPFHEAGIMSIFHVEPTALQLAWATLVTAYVNES